MALVKRMVSLFSALVISFGAIAYAYDPNKGAAYACDAEPVQLVRSLGIMTGHGDGELDLDGILTRAQAAKMIYVARTGTDDKAYLFDMPGMGMFADVPRGYWAAGYINYCAAQGIVSGRGNNTFDPDGYITGFEYMKILLVALGYDAVEEKLANDRDWKLFTVTTAAEAGLTEGFDEDPAGFITRSRAAVMTSNMIFAKTVAYNSKKQRVIGDSSFGEKYLKLKANKGIVTANGFTDPALTGRTRIRIHEKGSGSPGDYHVPTGFDELGLSVIIYTKGDSFTDIYGTANVSTDNRILTSYSGLAEGEKTKQGTLLRWMWDNDLEIGENAPVYITKGIGPESGEPIVSNSPGEWLRAIDNDGDGRVDYMIKISKTAATVLTIPEDENDPVVFDGIVGAWSRNNITGLSGISEGDFVLAYEYGGKLHLNKAPFITGKMSKSVPALGKATVGDTDYVVSGLAFDDIDGAETGAVTFVEWISDMQNFMKERIFFLDDGGNVILIRTPASEIPVKNYAMVLDSGRSYGNPPFTPQSAVVMLLYTDGNTGILNVNRIGDSLVGNMSRDELDRLFDPGTGHEDLVTGDIFDYSLNPDGSVDLRPVSNQTAAPASITRNDPNLVPGSVFADAKTVFISYNSEKRISKTYTGIQDVPSYSSITGSVVYEGMAAKAVFITSSVTVPAGPEYVYICDGPTVILTRDGDLAYTYTVYKKDGPGTLTVDEMNGDLRPGLYRYTVSEWGVFCFETAEDVKGTVSFAGDGVLAVGATAYILDDSTSVNRIKADGTVTGTNRSQLRVGTRVIVAPSLSGSPMDAEMIFILP